MNAINKFRDIVKQYPDKVAIVDNNTKVTYRELEQRSLKIANYLNSHGIGKEDIVGVYMNRSYDSVSSTIGILLSGAAFLPIDVKTPVERIDYMMNQSQAKLMLINEASNRIHGVSINQILNTEAKSEPCYLDIDIGKEDLAYIIFTSGSTGEPKGAMIENRGMNHHLSEKIRILGLDHNCVVAHNAPISFDVSVWQMIAPLCVGGTIVIFSEHQVLSVRKFVKLLVTENVTVLEIVPVYLKFIIDECSRKNYNLNSLKYVISTGEELKLSLAKRWFEIFDNIPLINAYGPTEASDDITHSIITSTTIHDISDIVPIGKPINKISLYIKNERLEDCDIDQMGELWVSGICVGRGYINNAEETKKHFFVDEKTNERMYYTGDLVTLRKDGNFYYYGRKDDQIKIHGNRIELREIENHILSYSGINDVKAFYNQKEDRIEAMIIVSDTINVDFLREYLKNRIPDYMIPAIFWEMDYFPLNINGKVDIHRIDQYIRSGCKHE